MVADASARCEMPVEHARKRVKLWRTGGSQSVTLPKAWLERLGASDEVDLVQVDGGVLIEAPRSPRRSIEDEPEFAAFLGFLTRKTLAHPESLGDMGELMAGDADPLRGVDPD
jgi:antitoxin component of MazEF toxin-antitoxin module